MELPKYPLIDSLIKKWCVCVCIYINYSAIKMNEILPFAIAWMYLEGIMLCEISQTENDKYHMISLICGI